MADDQVGGPQSGRASCPGMTIDSEHRPQLSVDKRSAVAYVSILVPNCRASQSRNARWNEIVEVKYRNLPVASKHIFNGYSLSSGLNFDY